MEICLRRNIKRNMLCEIRWKYVCAEILIEICNAK